MNIEVEVIYVPYLGASFRKRMLLPVGSDVATAIRHSGILQAYPDWELANLSVGVYSKKVSLDAGLQHHDQVEIYQELKFSPKVSRRIRARKNSK